MTPYDRFGVLLSLSFWALPSTRGATPVDWLSVESRIVTAGALGEAVPLVLDNETYVYGFQLSLATDPGVLRFVEVDLRGTAAEAAEFSHGAVRDEGATLSWGVVMEVSEPFDSDGIPPGADLTLALLRIDVVAESPTTASIRFEDRPGTPASTTKLFEVDGSEVPANLVDGEIQIIAGLAVLFVRGDADGDGLLRLTDGVFTLSYLFRGGAAPQCLDAADADDSGDVALTDAVYTFRALFSGGEPIPPPFPDPGVDPTADTLDCSPG